MDEVKFKEGIFTQKFYCNDISNYRNLIPNLTAEKVPVTAGTFLVYRKIH